MSFWKFNFSRSSSIPFIDAGVAIHITAKDREECWRGCAAALGINLPISQEGGENKYKKSEQDSSQELESEKGEMREIIPDDALNEIEEALREIANKNDASGKDHEEIWTWAKKNVKEHSILFY